MKVLTVKTDRTTTEIHMLNPGQYFEGFGGSTTGGLVVGGTASMVTRTITEHGTVEDVEREITDPQIWEALAQMINGKVHAEAKTKERKTKDEDK